jgi:hypothetical protein
MLAPIVLFVYNRLDHTRKTIEALSNNLLANESDLFIFSDSPKDTTTVDKVQEVRDYIKKVQGFKSITVIERDRNWGLAISIIDGVTDVINKYGKVIVLEDDIVTSPYFLTYMNKALNFYTDKPRVWHISGYMCPINTNKLEDVFLWRTMDCWGWATWESRWRYFEKNPDKLISTFSKHDIYRFNINGTENMWGQVLDNKTGKINTWAIFWYASIFKQNGLCLSPTMSFVQNIGLDGSGVHCGESSAFLNGILCEKDIDFRHIEIKENRIALKRIMTFYKNQKKRNYILVIIKRFQLLVSSVKKLRIA